MRVTRKARKLLADIKKMCNDRDCGRCTFYDKELKCRLGLPFAWMIDDWKEYKDEAN